MKFKKGDRVECTTKRHPTLSKGEVVEVKGYEHSHGQIISGVDSLIIDSEDLILFGNGNWGLHESDAKLFGNIKPAHRLMKHEF